MGIKPAPTTLLHGGFATPLNLDHLGTLGVVPGADAQHPDNIIFDIKPVSEGGLLNPVGTLSQSASGFGHPTCVNTNLNTTSLPAVKQ